MVFQYCPTKIYRLFHKNYDAIDKKQKKKWLVLLKNKVIKPGKFIVFMIKFVLGWKFTKPKQIKISAKYFIFFSQKYIFPFL